MILLMVNVTKQNVHNSRDAVIHNIDELADSAGWQAAITRGDHKLIWGQVMMIVILRVVMMMIVILRVVVMILVMLRVLMMMIVILRVVMMMIVMLRVVMMIIVMLRVVMMLIVMLRMMMIIVMLRMVMMLIVMLRMMMMIVMLRMMMMMMTLPQDYLLKRTQRNRSHSVQLYNVAVDPSETRNIAAQFPNIVDSLKAEILAAKNKSFVEADYPKGEMCPAKI